MPRVIHFEIPAEDPEKIVKFYSEVFGWNIKRWGEEDYWLVDTGPKSEPGISGGIYRKDWMTVTTNTVPVDDVEAYLEKVKAAGGKVAREPMDIPQVGRLAYFTDPEGTLMGIIKPSEEMKNM